MDTVILITGDVNYTINLDPAIWTFDERKFELTDKLPGTSGTAIELKHFLNHAEPSKTATHLICHRGDLAPVTITLDQAKTCFLCFAINDQPLTDQGPILLYLADGSNKDHPIDQITKFEVISSARAKK